jgi:hypothetical protein
VSQGRRGVGRLDIVGRTAIVLLALATSAHAQPTASASAEADALFDQGRELLRAGKIAQACEAFDASQKIAAAVSTLLNQADCREQNQQYATAYGLFRDAERQTRTASDPYTEGLSKLARDRGKALEARFSTLTIVVPDAVRVGGLEILRNGSAIEPLTWGHALPADGGTYTITARAPEHEPWSTTIRIELERDAKTVTIEPLAAQVAATPVAGSAPSPRSRLVPLALGGSAVVVLGGALGFELWARREYADAKLEADDVQQESLWKGAKVKRYVAQGMLVAGVATASLATWLYMRAGREQGVTITPAVDGQSAAVFVGGGF